MVRGERSIPRENLAKIDQPPSKKADFQSIFARSASAITPSEKVKLTRIGSPLYKLSNEQWA